MRINTFKKKTADRGDVKIVEVEIKWLFPEPLIRLSLAESLHSLEDTLLVEK